MLRVIAGLSGVFEDVQVGGTLTVRLQIGSSHQGGNHPGVAEYLQEEAKVHLEREEERLL